MKCEPVLFYNNIVESEKEKQEVVRQQTVQINTMAKQDPQNFPKMIDISDVALFVHCVFDKLYDCSKFLDSKSELLQNMVQGKITDKVALLQLVLRKELPRNDSFASLYEQAKKNIGDLQLKMGSDVIYCHEIVLRNNSYLKAAFKVNNQINNDQFGQNLSKQQLELPSWMKPKAVWKFVKFYYKGCVEF